MYYCGLREEGERVSNLGLSENKTSITEIENKNTCSPTEAMFAGYMYMYILKQVRSILQVAYKQKSKSTISVWEGQ